MQCNDMASGMCMYSNFRRHIAMHLRDAHGPHRAACLPLHPGGPRHVRWLQTKDGFIHQYTLDSVTLQRSCAYISRAQGRGEEAPLGKDFKGTAGRGPNETQGAETRRECMHG